MYPVIAMDDPAAHPASREQLLGPTPEPDRIKAYSADSIVPNDAPEGPVAAWPELLETWLDWTFAHAGRSPR
jgi:hypothetical protein